MSMLDNHSQHIWHPFTQMQTAGTPITISHGEGALLYDESGKAYIDAIASWWVNLHGHAHPYISQKVHAQMEKLHHVVFAGFTHAPAKQLCIQLAKHLPSNQAKFFFSGDGSSAVEIALKMAIQYWRNKGEKRSKILALDGGYHGETFGAMSAGARSIFSAPFNDYLFAVDHLPFPSADNEAQTVAALQKALASGKVAAFIFEPLVQGASGMRMYAPKVLDKLMALCHQHGVLCIADEVMTGFGRTGTFFATNQVNQQPDLICLSKGLTGGTLPLSLTTCTQAIYEAFLGDDLTTAFLHGHSYTGNPIGCAAALASIELLEKENCQNNLKRIAASHQAFAHSLQGHPLIKEIRQTGTILALELNDDEGGYTSQLRQQIYQKCLDRGVLLRPLGNVVYILPPYCISNTELQKVYSTLVEVLHT